MRAWLLLILASSSPVLAADQPQPDAPEKAPSAASPGPECKLSPKKMANPDAYRPSAESHSGRVVVEFTIPQSGAKPVDLVVAESSSYPALDAAALRVIEDSRFKTTCPDMRTKVAVKFNPPHQASAR